jgi:DNA invertase Pin-like site-specific DNA recombinase
MKSAVAYINAVEPSRGSQTESIKRYAAENEIEIVAWFEDEGREQDPLKRPGIQALLAYDGACELVLCERVWLISRSTDAVESFFKEVESRGWSFHSVTVLWDKESQHYRRKFDPALSTLPHVHRSARRRIASEVRVARPARLNFRHLA